MIIRNAARCRACDTVIESKYRHDFKSCRCTAIFVDGGTAFLRHGFDSRRNFEDLSVIWEPPASALEAFE